MNMVGNMHWENLLTLTFAFLPPSSIGLHGIWLFFRNWIAIDQFYHYHLSCYLNIRYNNIEQGSKEWLPIRHDLYLLPTLPVCMTQAMNKYYMYQYLNIMLRAKATVCQSFRTLIIRMTFKSIFLLFSTDYSYI